MNAILDDGAVHDIKRLLTEHYLWPKRLKNLWPHFGNGLTVGEFNYLAFQALDDPFTSVVPLAEYQQDHFSVCGVGIALKVPSVSMSAGNELGDAKAYPIVEEVLCSSQAGKKGICAGDLLVSIDDRQASGLTVDSLNAMLVGPEKSWIRLTILPADSQSRPRTLTLQRQHLAWPVVVKTTVGQEEINYIRLRKGADLTAIRLTGELRRAISSGGELGTICDFRGVLGGSLDIALEVLAELGAAAGEPILKTEGRSASSEHSRICKLPRVEVPKSIVNLVVLVDGLTASAAELVAGVLQQKQLAWSVGTPPLGKGVMQKAYDIQWSGGVRLKLKLTTAKVYLPDGHWAGDGYRHRYPLPPKQFEPQLSEYEPGSDYDRQFQAAVRYIRARNVTHHSSVAMLQRG